MAELKVKKKKKSPVLLIVLGIVALVVIAWVVWEATDNDTGIENEVAETEQQENESFYAEPDDWEGTSDAWDDETTVDEDWSAESESERWGDQSSAAADDEMADEEMYAESENATTEDPVADEDDDTFGMDYSGAVGTEVNEPEWRRQQEENFKSFIAFSDEMDADDLNRRITYRGIKKLIMAISALEATDSTMVAQKTDIDQIKRQTELLKDEQMRGQQAFVIKNSLMDIARTFKNLQKKTEKDIEEEISEVMEAAEKINDRDMASKQRAEIDDFFNEAADVLEKLKDNSKDDASS